MADKIPITKIAMGIRTVKYPSIKPIAALAHEAPADRLICERARCPNTIDTMGTQSMPDQTTYENNGDRVREPSCERGFMK